MATTALTILTLPSGSELDRNRLLDSIRLVSGNDAFLKELEALRHDEYIKKMLDAGFSKTEIERDFPRGMTPYDFRTIDYESPDEIRVKYYADLSDKEILTRLHDRYSKKVDFASVETAYEKGMARLRTKQLETILFSFLVWLGISLGVYGLGYSAGWVINGFRQKQ
ncbi:MAG TPA: hypothetical protein VIS94_12245 [Desulfomonilia bacterium]